MPVSNTNETYPHRARCLPQHLALRESLNWLVPLIVVAFMTAAYFWLRSPPSFRGDAWEIWEVSRNYFDPNRARSFVEYRGPFVFLLFHALHRIAFAFGIDATLAFKVFSGGLLCLLTLVLVPEIVARLLRRAVSPWARVAFAASTLYFFGGYFLHPQVDILALSLFLTATLLVLRADSARYPTLVYAAASLSLLLAVLTRFNYVVALPVLAFILYLDHRSAGRPWRVIAARLAVLCTPALALFIIAFAQPGVSGQDRVLRMQLTVGLKVQKIEWNAGDVRFPGAIEVRDPAGHRVYDRITTPQAPWVSPSQYLNAVAAHPVVFAGMWARHFFNGVDLWYDEVYVTELHQGRVARSLLNFVALFAFALLLVRMLPKWSGPDGRSIVAVLGITLPALSAIPFVIEVRFFMPVLLLAQGFAVLASREWLPMLRSKGVVAALLLFVGLCMTASLSMSSAAGIHPLGRPFGTGGIANHVLEPRTDVTVKSAPLPDGLTRPAG